ncbi:MAG: M23 family metallopeptidase [Candidatus Eisenbacteria bacterium]
MFHSWLQSFVIGRITIVVVPHAGKDVRSYRIPVGLIHGALLAVLLGTLATGNALLRTADLARAKGKVVRLSEENGLLAGELDQVKRRLDGLSGEMETLVAFEGRIRTVADLDPIDDDVRQVGVGGPVIGQRTDLIAYREESPKEAFALDRVVLDASTLSRQARLLEESFSQVLETLEERKDELARTPSVMPVANCWITTGYGYRSDPFTGRRAMHYGVDLSARRGEPVMATADGKVVFTGRKASLGNTVEIDHGNGLVTRYGHNHRIFVERGQEVVRGQVIAAVGSSGRSTNPHLHYEVRVDRRSVDPLKYIIGPVASR